MEAHARANWKRSCDEKSRDFVGIGEARNPMKPQQTRRIVCRPLEDAGNRLLNAENRLLFSGGQNQTIRRKLQIVSKSISHGKSIIHIRIDFGRRARYFLTKPRLYRQFGPPMGLQLRRMLRPLQRKEDSLRKKDDE